LIARFAGAEVPRSGRVAAAAATSTRTAADLGHKAEDCSATNRRWNWRRGAQAVGMAGVREDPAAVTIGDGGAAR